MSETEYLIVKIFCYFVIGLTLPLLTGALMSDPTPVKVLVSALVIGIPLVLGLELFDSRLRNS